MQKAGLTKVVQLRSKRVFSSFPIGGETKKHPWDRIPRGRFHTTILGGLLQAVQKAGLTEVVYSTFPIGAKRKKHPWDRIPRSRFHTTILGGLFREAENAALTKVVQLRLKLVFSSFHIRAKRKNTLGIEFHEVGFIPPFLVGFCKQRKKPGWRRSSNSVQNSFFRLSPSRRNEESPLESNLPISVSYHHFCRAFASTAKSRVDEGRPIALKPHFFDFPHRCETKKHTSDRIPRGRFHTTIFGGLLQAAQKAGLTKFVQLRWKLVFSSFPIGAKRKNTLGIEFHEACFIPPFWVGFSKQRKTAGWRRSSNCVQNSFFDFRHHGETKNHPWNRIYQFRFHTTIFGGLFQASKKAGLTKVVQLRSKLVNSTFPIGGNRKNTLGIEFHEVGFIAPFLLCFCKQCKKPGWRRSSNCVQNSFIRLSPSGRNEKTPLGSNSTRSLLYYYFGWAFASSAKSQVDEVPPIVFKTRFFDFPHRGEWKKHPWIEFNEFGIIPPFWESFWKQRKKPGWRRSSNCVQNSFFRLSQSGRNEKTPFGSNSTRSVSYDHFGWAFPSSAKSRVDEGRPIAFKTRFFDFPHRGKTKKHPWIEFNEFGIIPPFWESFWKQRKKPGWRRSSNCVQNSFFRLSQSGRNEKTPFGSNSTRSVSYDHFGWAFPSSAKSRVDEGRPIAFKTRFFDFPHRGKTKKHPWIEFNEFVIIPPFWEGFTKERKTPGWGKTSNCVENSFFRVSPYGRNEKTPLGSNSTRSVSYHHFGWALPSSGKRRDDEVLPIGLKTRFVEFSHRDETKKHPWDRIPRGRFHTNIFAGPLQAVQKGGLTKVVHLPWKLVFSTFPVGAKRKNTLGIEFHEVDFIPPFWVGFTKQRKTPGWRRSSNCVQNSFFRLSPSGPNEKAPLGSISTRSVSYHHFGWALRSSGKRRDDEVLPIGLKTRFFDFPHRSETKKHTWDRIPRGRFHTTILGWTYQAAEKAGLTKVFQLGWKLVLSSSPIRGKQKKNPWDRIPWGRFHTTIFSALLHAVQKAGLTKVVQLRWKLVSSSFPIGAKRKNTLGFEFHEVGFIPLFLLGFTKQRKTLGWRRSSNCVQNSFCRVSPSGRNEKTPLGSNSTRSVSYHHFGWDLPRSGRRRVDEGRPIALKTRFFEFPHMGESKKHPLDRIPRGRFHTTILGGLFPATPKAGLTKVVQLRSKLVSSSFPIGAKRKNTIGFEFQEVGFIPLFLLGFTKQRKTPGWRRSSNCVQNSFCRVSPSGRNEKTPLWSNSTRSVSYHHFGWDFPSSAKRRFDQGRPIGLKTRFVEFPHRDGTKKHPWDQIPRGRFHTTIFAGLLQAVQKGGLTNVVQLRWKLVFSSFPIGAKRKNTLLIEFHEVGFIPPFWVGFSQQRKTPGWRRSSNCVQNSFFRLSTSGQNEKTPLGSNSTRSVSYHHFGVDLPSSGKGWVDEGCPIAFKTRFFEIPHRGKTKKHPWDRIPRVSFQTTILGRLLQAAQKASCVVHRVQCTVSSAESTVYRV